MIPKGTFIVHTSDFIDVTIGLIYFTKILLDFPNVLLVLNFLYTFQKIIAYHMNTSQRRLNKLDRVTNEHRIATTYASKHESKNGMDQPC